MICDLSLVICDRRMIKGLKYIILAANIAFFAVMAMVLPLGFEENDDVAMAMIANGSYSGAPDGHLVFINILYGWVIAALYSWTTAIEWYTLAFAVLQILSMSVLAYCILTMPNRSRWERVLWMILLYVLWARMIVALQFTTTAGVVCLAGCMLLLRERKRARWTGVLLVIVASLIRYHAASLVGLLMAPIILFTYRTEWRKYLPLLLMMVVAVGCRMVNKKIYDSDPEWKYYREYNMARAQLNDNPSAYKLQQENLPEGVDIEDYKLLLQFTPDAEQIDLPTIQALQKRVGETPRKEQFRNLHRLDKYVVEIIILLAILVLMMLATGNKSKYIFLILYTLFVMVLIIHVGMTGFLKNRVFICMLMPMMMTDFVLLPKTTGTKRTRSIVIILALLSGWYVYQTIDTKINAHRKKDSLVWEQIPLIKSVSDNSYLVTLGTSMRMEATEPWNIWPYSCRKYTLGWMTYIPFNKTVGHSYKALLRDDVYVFTDARYAEENTALQRICGQIEKHYGIPTTIECLSANERYAVVKIKGIRD